MCVVLAHVGRHTYAHCRDLFCLAVSAFLATVASRIQTFPQVSSYQSSLWGSGASKSICIAGAQDIVTSNISRFSVLRWALTSQLCVCFAGATLPERLPTQRQRMTHRMPSGPGRTYPRRDSREVLTIRKNSRHIFSHDVPTFQHIDHNCVPEKPYGARAEDQDDSARMKRD